MRMTVRPLSKWIFLIFSEKSFSEVEKKFGSEKIGKQKRKLIKKKVRNLDIFYYLETGK